MQNKWHASIVSLLLLLQVGCGFHLRHSWPLPDELHRVYLQTSAPYSYLILQFKKMLRSLNVTLLEEPADNAITLKLYNGEYKKTVISESASASTTEYQLTYQMTYQLLKSNGESLYDPQTISITRHLLVSEDQVLSSTNESAVSQQEMQREALVQLLNQLSSPKVAKAIHTNTTAAP
jgi:LPS-assembly lipoprotein